MRRALPALAVLTLSLLAACGAPSAADPATPAAAGDAPLAGISARGTGTVEGRPDTLTVVLGVETRATRAADALADNNERARALIETLEREGVDERDIQTSRLSIHPTYDDDGARITGYQVSNSVTAVLHDIDAAGDVIDAAAAAAGDAVRVHHIGFSIDDDGALKASARAEAVAAARTQAEQLADAAGVRLGRLRSVVEVPGGGAVPYADVSLGGAPGVAARPVPIEPGTQELSVQVEVVYDIAT